MPTVAYLSDIHLEFYPGGTNPVVDMAWPTGDILCLAGDIGHPETPAYAGFLAECSRLFQYVFLVAGNHEYYQTSAHPSKTMHETDETIRDVCRRFHNVHFLSNASFHVPEFDLHVLGTTLWTGGDVRPADRFLYSDFRRIDDLRRGESMQNLHEASVRFLREHLPQHRHDGSTVLVLTHHLPSYELIAPMYRNSGLNHLFATNLDDLFRDYTIHHWVCGHSHQPTQTTIGDTKVWMNPIGYPGENADVCWTRRFEL